MNPEQLSDAMNELPQELLEETQAARSGRRLRWKPLAAAAACLLLAAGAWALAGRPAEPTPDPDLPVLTIDRDYGGMGDYRLSAEEFAAYDGGPWQEGMELTSLPVFRNTTRVDVTNGFRTGGGDYAQLRRTMERLAAAAGADVAQAAVEARVLRDFAPHCTPEQRALIRRRADAYAALAQAETPDYNRLYEADRLLHETWFAAMGKMYLFRTLQNAHADYSRFRMLDTMTSGGLDEVIADHQNIIAAIERCDLAAFEPLVERHLYGGIRRLGSKLTEEYADYFEPEK